MSGKVTPSYLSCWEDRDSYVGIESNIYLPERLQEGDFPWSLHEAIRRGFERHGIKDWSMDCANLSEDEASSKAAEDPRGGLYLIIYDGSIPAAKGYSRPALEPKVRIVLAARGQRYKFLWPVEF